MYSTEYYTGHRPRFKGIVIRIPSANITVLYEQENTPMSVEYRLCAADTAEELNRQVNELLREDWALYGSPFFTTGKFCQAVTKVPKKVAGVR